MRRLKDCTTSLINHFKKAISSSKKDLPGDQSTIIPKISITDESKSESNESIDSGFVESIPGSCSEHSSLSSKSILRNSTRQPDQPSTNLVSGDKKSTAVPGETRKKVSIIAPILNSKI